MTFYVYFPNMERNHSYSASNFNSLDEAKAFADSKMKFIKEHYSFDLCNDDELYVTDKKTGSELKHYDNFGIVIHNEITEPCSEPSSHYRTSYKADGSIAYEYISSSCYNGLKTVSNERVYEKYWNSSEEAMVSDIKTVDTTSYDL